MMASKNLLSGAQGAQGGFTNGVGPDLKQQLLDEEESRRLQMVSAKNPQNSYGGSVNNMASMALLGAGGSLGQ